MCDGQPADNCEFMKLGLSVGTVQPASVVASKQTLVCESFSDDNCKVTVSSCRRSVKGIRHANGSDQGYCFLSHPKVQKNQILKWSLRVPKSKSSGIGTVIILE